MFERLKAMLVKEFIQVFRDPKMRIIIFILPVFQTIVFGYAVNTDVRDIKTAVYDLDNSPASRDLIARFAGSGYFRIIEHVYGDRRVEELIDQGTVKAVLRMNRGFAAELGAGRAAALQILLDGTDSNTAGIVLNYAGKIAADYNDRIRLEQAARAFGPSFRVGGVEMASRAWFNENLESRNFYVPAVIANIVFIITMLLSSMAVVREKEIGTMEQIIVTPIRRSEFILGKTVPFILIGFIDVALITLVAAFWFGVPIRGNIPLLFGATALFLMSSLGFGLLISTVSRTQQQAMMSAFFFIFPAMLLSGFAFPIENMPVTVQWLTFLNPLRYYLVIIRGIFLKGVGLAILWQQFFALFLLGIVILGFAVSRFRKTL
ncbi:MAG: ABC transporter permease [Deltaproteobacteria bacterium]|nr:ABC transporter permease [Deltaproteobacteria bacterium]TLN01723.1 MAG: ABC transporter permease [bacterium]